MPIVRLNELLENALRGGYCIGYFESWDQYSLDAVLEASEASSSPAILGFGAAVTCPAWMDRHGVEELVSMARLLASRTTVPTAVLFNEARTEEQTRRAVEAGCNAIMLDTSHLSFAENLALTKRLVSFAHPRGVDVEAELGRLGDATPSSASPSSSMPVFTDPGEAADFIRQTGVDALAVSVGGVHCLSSDQVEIDLRRLEAIHALVPVPLVLHGGSGLAPTMVRPAVERGVAKINYGTRLKESFLAGVRQALAELPDRYSIHDVIGSKNDGDVMMRGKDRVRQLVEDLVKLYGCAGKAMA